MKKIYKKQLLFSVLMLSVFLQAFIISNGQEASVNWPFTENIEPVINGNISAEGPIPMGFTSYQTSNHYLIKAICSFDLNPDKYVQFEVAPLPNNILQVNELSAYMELSAITDCAYAQIWISLSPDFIDYQILASEFNIPTAKEYYNFILNTIVPDGKRLYIRLYPYGYRPEFEPYNLRISDITLTGFTSAVNSIAYEKNEWCTNEGTAEINLIGPEGGTFSSDPGLAINPSTGSIDLAISQPGIYTVNYTISNEIIASTGITILSSPDCSINGPEGPVLSSSIYTYMAPEGMTIYSWSLTGDASITGSSGEQTVTVETDAISYGSFSLLLTTGYENGCTHTCTENIVINVPDPGILPTATLSGTQSICFGNSADLVVYLTGQPPWTFTWTDGTNEYTVTETSESQHVLTVSPTVNTMYSLTGQVTDGSGQTNDATGEARIYFGPVTLVPHLVACPGNIVEVPITVRTFNKVRDISLALKYDSEVLAFQEAVNGDITFGENGIGGIQVNNNVNETGIITISKYSEEDLPALNDDAVLLRLKFAYLGGDSELKWIDSPDDSWCSYSFMSELDETGFETEAFCDVPAETYYANGSVKQLTVSGTEVSPISNVSTITGTPVIIPVSVTYPDLAAQEINPVVLTDARIGYNGTGTFPAGARIFQIMYNGNSVLATPFELGEKNEILLSEILGTAPNPLLNHSNQTILWEIYVDGIDAEASLPVIVEALAYTELSECAVVMDTETFTLTFADAVLSATESVTICGATPLQFTAQIEYPQINNLNTKIKADACITASGEFPQGTVIEWDYNNSTSGSYTLPSGTTELMLSSIVGTQPNPLQGHTGTDAWTLTISNAGLMTDNLVTIEAVAELEGVYYVHSEDIVMLTANPAPEITGLMLLTSPDESNWTGVDGDLTSGYNLCADPAVAYHFMGVNEMTGTLELNNDFTMNAFYLDVTALPDRFYEYWNNKNVNISATEGWEAVMWAIITGVEPMFYIKDEGTEHKLIDGLQYLYYNTESNLRIWGDFPAGSYTFSGTVTNVYDCISEAVSIMLNISSAPVITCPGNIETNTDPGECGAAVIFDATATGSPAPDIIYTLDNYKEIQTGYFFPLGTTTVTATAENDCKSVSCTFDVTVIDNEAPEIFCPVTGNLDVIMNNACTYLKDNASWDAIASDNCTEENLLSYTLEGQTTGTGTSLNGVAFNEGITTVIWTATDAAGKKTECSFTVTVSGVNLNGTLTYYNMGKTPLDNAIITLLEPVTGNIVATHTTNTTGEYSFINLCPGTYEVSIATDKPMRSINSTDAGQVNAWNVAQTGGIWPSIEKVRFLAGDVNGAKDLDSGDAGIIQYYFLTLGTEDLFDKDWEFWKVNVPVTSQPQTDNLLQIEVPAGSSGMIQDFYGLVSGDFNRSNVPAPNSINPLFMKSARAMLGSVNLLKGDTLLANKNSIVEIPLRALSDMKVGAISLILDFPRQQLLVEDVYLEGNPNRPAGFNVLNGRLVIGWNSLNPISVKAGNPLVTLIMKVKDVMKMPYFFRLANDPLNELADENMTVINNASLRMDGLVIKEGITGINISKHQTVLKMTCWPNPFKESISIRYILPSEGLVSIDATGITGNNISILQDRQQTAGEYQFDFDGSHLVPGIYTIALRLTAIDGSVQLSTVGIIKL